MSIAYFPFVNEFNTTALQQHHQTTAKLLCHCRFPLESCEVNQIHIYINILHRYMYIQVGEVPYNIVGDIISEHSNWRTLPICTSLWNVSCVIE